MDNIVNLIIRGNDQSAKAIASSVKGLQGMDSALTGISRQLSGILSIGALVSLAKSAIDLGSSLDDASKKFGVSASELSALQYVAKLSGVEFEDLGVAFKFLSKAIAESQNPSSDAAIAFKAMGISVRDSKGNLKGTDALFMELADAFAGMKDGANKTALAMAIFGRSGANILPVLADGAAGVKKLKDEAKSLGAQLTEEEIKNLDAYGDAIDRIGMVAKTTAGRLMIDMGDTLKWLFRQNDISLNLVDKLNRGLSGLGGPKSAVQGKIADILVPNPEPGKKKDAPNIEAIKKAAEERKKLEADYSKLHAANMAKEGEAVHGALAAEMGWTQEYYDTVSKMRQQDFEDWKKQQAEEASLLEKFELDKIAMLADLQDAQRAEDEGGAATPYSFDDAMAAAEVYGNVSLAIQTMNSELGNTALILTENQGYIDLYEQAWLDANLAIVDSISSMYGGMQGWMSSSLQGLITGTMKAQDVVRNLGKMMLGVLTDYLAKWVVSRLLMAAMEKAFTVQQVVTTTAAAALIGAAWLEPAYLATVATLGEAAFEGVAALGIGMAAAQGLNMAMKTAGTLGGGLSDAINGGTGAAFASGTEYVPVTMPALVHKGERILTPEQNVDFTEFIKGGGEAPSVGMGGDVYLDGDKVGRWFAKRRRQYGDDLVFA